LKFAHIKLDGAEKIVDTLIDPIKTQPLKIISSDAFAFGKEDFISVETEWVGDRRMLKKERGVDNYEEALKWMRRALDHRTLHMRAREVIERSICHVLRRASERVEKEGDDKKALQYARESFKAWMAYLKEYPPLGF